MLNTGNLEPLKKEENKSSLFELLIFSVLKNRQIQCYTVFNNILQQDASSFTLNPKFVLYLPELKGIHFEFLKAPTCGAA